MLHKKTQANAMLMFLLNRSHNSNQNVLQLRIRLCKTLAIKDHKYESDLKSFVGCCCCWLLVVRATFGFSAWVAWVAVDAHETNAALTTTPTSFIANGSRTMPCLRPPPTAHRTSPRPAATFNFNWLLLLRFQ